MVRRSIAALLLMSMTAWAEIALAPLFTIHASHLVHVKAAPQEEHQHAMPGHPCCPGGAQMIATTLQVKAANLPCEEQHRCCFRQGPASPPTTAKEIRDSAPEISVASAELWPNFGTFHSLLSLTQPVVHIPPGEFGVVLRI